MSSSDDASRPLKRKRDHQGIAIRLLEKEKFLSRPFDKLPAVLRKFVQRHMPSHTLLSPEEVGLPPHTLLSAEKRRLTSTSARTGLPPTAVPTTAGPASTATVTRPICTRSDMHSVSDIKDRTTAVPPMASTTSTRTTRGNIPSCPISPSTISMEAPMIT